MTPLPQQLPSHEQLVDWPLLLSHLWHMVIAYALAMPVAWNRERLERTAGLRTFPLVAVASCAYVLLATSVHEAGPDVAARILQGLVTGIGFIGGGAILKQDGRTSGTATAASIWSTGALGSAVAFDRFEIALLLCVFNYATFRWLSQIKDGTRADEQPGR